MKDTRGYNLISPGYNLGYTGYTGVHGDTRGYILISPGYNLGYRVTPGYTEIHLICPGYILGHKYIKRLMS
jgi:hypothetical protein